jgi:hypothetical protein
MEDTAIEIGRLPNGQETPKGLLYHYTTLEGLLGIVKSEAIRATHIRYLNDASELDNAFSPESTYPLLESLFPDPGQEVKELVRALMKPPQDRYDAFVASFTDDGATKQDPGDRLSQWRAYSDISGGCSLGFDHDLILKGWEKSGIRAAGAECNLLRCKYTALEKAQVAKSIGETRSKDFNQALNQYLSLFEGENGRAPNQAEVEDLQKRSIARVLGVSCADYYLEAAGFKDKSFSEELEWRILIHAVRQNLLLEHSKNPDVPIINFRRGKFGMTPYVELPLNLKAPESPLRRIVIGPAPHREESVMAVRMLLESNGIGIKGENVPNGVEVKGSEIPYRNW